MTSEQLRELNSQVVEREPAGRIVGELAKKLAILSESLANGDRFGTAQNIVNEIEYHVQAATNELQAQGV